MESALLPGEEAVLCMFHHALHARRALAPLPQATACPAECLSTRCSCIPVRIDSTKSGPDCARVLLISAHGGKGMVFPKVRWHCWTMWQQAQHSVLLWFHDDVQGAADTRHVRVGRLGN